MRWPSRGARPRRAANLAYSYFLAKQLERARSLNAEAMALAVRDGDPMTLAHVSTTQGIIRGAQGDTAGREALAAGRASTTPAQAGAKAEEALYLANLADFYLKNGEYPTALRYAQQALPLTRELKQPERRDGGAGQHRPGADRAARHRGRQAQPAPSIDIDERRGSITGMSDTYAEMGQYLEQAGDLRGAVEALHQHRALSDQILRRDQQQAILEMQEQFDSDRRTREIELLQRDGEIKSEQLRAARPRAAPVVAAGGELPADAGRRRAAAAPRAAHQPPARRAATRC